MFNKFLSLYLCGYGKDTSHTKALISLIVKWANLLQIKHFNRAVLMDLSKAFDKNHDLLIAKIHTDCFDKSFLMLFSYITHRFQRAKFNSTFTSWEELIRSFPQGSLFNIYPNNMFCLSESEMTNICNKANLTTFHESVIDLIDLIYVKKN